MTTSYLSKTIAVQQPQLPQQIKAADRLDKNERLSAVGEGDKLKTNGAAISCAIEDRAAASCILACEMTVLGWRRVTSKEE